LQFQINKRLDVVMKRGASTAYTKDINVLSSSNAGGCDRHPNVTYYLGK